MHNYIAAHKDEKTEDLAYSTQHGLCTSARKAYVQFKKCFYVMTIPPNICHIKITTSKPPLFLINSGPMKISKNTRKNRKIDIISVF